MRLSRVQHYLWLTMSGVFLRDVTASLGSGVEKKARPIFKPKEIASCGTIASLSLLVQQIIRLPAATFSWRLRSIFRPCLGWRRPGGGEVLAARPAGRSRCTMALGPLPFGDGTFSSPATSHPLECFSYKPVSYNARSSPLLVVLHGAQRNAVDYRDWSKALADKTGALVVAPHFPAEHFSLWRYRTGGIFAKDHSHHDDDDTRSAEPLLDLAPEERWLAVILYRCIAHVRLLESSPSMPYHFFAHSAGAQLLHRLLLFRPDPSASSIVVANSGSYTFPDLSWDFPYGLRGLPPEFRKGSVLPSLLKAFVEAPLTLAIGTEDVLTTGQHMDMSKLAMREGGNRRERAQAVFETYKKLAHEQGWDFRWSFLDVQGVGHDGQGMLQSPEVAGLLTPLMAHQVEVTAMGAADNRQRRLTSKGR